jgi:hypothetical protein
MAVVGVVSFLVLGYTPTTTGYVQNDTVNTVTLDNCSDSSVTVTAGTREQIAPFQDANRGCTVFSGTSDLGTPTGCLYMPSSHGQTVAGSVGRVSEMRQTPGRGCH